MLRLLSFIFLFVCSVSLLAKKNYKNNSSFLSNKQSPIDSLVKYLDFPKEDSVRTFHLNQISYLLKNTNPVQIFDSLETTKNQLELSQIAQEISQIYENNNNLSRAILYCQYGLLYADSVSAIIQKKDLLYNLYSLYYKSGNSGLALDTYKKYNSLKDSLNTILLLDTIAKLKSNTNEQRLTDAELFKKDLNSIDQKITKQNNLINYLYALIVSLLLLILFLIFKIFTSRKKQLVEKNESKILLNDEKQKVVYFEKMLKDAEQLHLRLQSDIKNRIQEEENNKKEVLSTVDNSYFNSTFSLNETNLIKIGVTDMSDLIQFAGNDKVIICSFLKMILNRIPELTNQIENQLETEDMEGVRNTTKAMKHLLFEILSNKYKSLVVNVTRSIETEDKLRPTMITDFIKICRMALVEVSDIVK